MENKLNTGAIFKNTNKKAENHPDYKGKVNVNRKNIHRRTSYPRQVRN